MTRQDILNGIDEEILGYCRLVTLALTSSDLEPRFAFDRHFRDARTRIAEAIGVALTMLSLFTHRLDANDYGRIRVTALVYTTMNLQLSSFKLFMSGHTVASGALFRQVIEGVSLGFLFSVPSLGFLERFDSGHYTAKGAVRDLKRKAKEVHVREAALDTLLDAYDFYHKYAHLSKLTIAATANFSRAGAPQIGALFDEAKLPQYQKEVRSRVSFARRMPNAVHGICRNLASW